MNIASDDSIFRLAINWDEKFGNAEVVESSDSLNPIYSFVYFANRRIIHSVLLAVLNEEGVGMDQASFSYEPDEIGDWEWDGVVVEVPDYVTDGPYGKVFISRGAWRRFVIRWGEMFLQHPTKESAALDIEITDLLRQLREQEQANM